MAKTPKPKAAKTPKPKAVKGDEQMLSYIGRNRETTVAGIKFEANKATRVADKALFDKLSKNPYFEVAE